MCVGYTVIVSTLASILVLSPKHPATCNMLSRTPGRALGQRATPLWSGNERKLEVVVMSCSRGLLGGGRRALIAALGVSALAFAAPASADLKASLLCRGSIAKGIDGIQKNGFKLNDICHKTQDKVPTGTGACNDVANPAFDPGDKY